MIAREIERPRPRLLIVDDDAAVRLMFREALAQAGFQVHEAEHGAAALKMFEVCRPELILMDVVMPEMDGFTACARIKAVPHGEHIPILMMTGLDDMESINRAYEVGATDFITKPINSALLTHRVRYVLRSKATADQLRLSQQRLINAQRIAKLGYWHWDLHKQRLYGSPEVRGLLGIPEHVQCLGSKALLNYTHPEDKDTVEQVFDAALSEGTGYSIEHRIVRADGTVITVHQEAELGTGSDAGCLIGTIQDVTERKRAEAQIKNLAFYDSVTGLANRAMLRRQLSQALAAAKRFQRSLAVMVVDLDHFKRINDTLGHNAGDDLLRQAAQRLSECLRCTDFVGRDPQWTEAEKAPNHDTVARLGGDEFVVMLSEIKNAEDAAVAARRMNASFQEPFHVEGHELFVTASIGISAYPVDGEQSETLLKHADAAMYHAKANGRDRYQFYTASMNTRAFARLSMEANLRKAVEQEQLLLHYQPKVCLADNRTVGAEALVRWSHPALGLVAPADFIPIAEETGLIVPIGNWILHKVCRTLHEWRDAGHAHTPIAVNLSTAQFKQHDLAAVIAAALAEHELPPELLELELTESLLMEDLDHNVDMLYRLRDLGLTLSIDDFGTGYSSLSYLKRFPISALKIDQSFIRDVNSDANDAAIVEAVIAMAHSLDLTVIAEGVEYRSQLEFLRQRGCDVAQGYLYSRPMPSDELAAWLGGAQEDARQRLAE